MKTNIIKEDISLERKLDLLAQEHAKAIAELDESEEENLRLINALRDIRKTLSSSNNDSSRKFREVTEDIIEIVNKHLK